MRFILWLDPWLWKYSLHYLISVSINLNNHISVSNSWLWNHHIFSETSGHENSGCNHVTAWSHLLNLVALVSLTGKFWYCQNASFHCQVDFLDFKTSPSVHHPQVNHSTLAHLCQTHIGIVMTEDETVFSTTGQETWGSPMDPWCKSSIITPI